MHRSLNHYLASLFSLSVILCISVIVYISFIKIEDYKAKKQLNQIMDIQISLESLSSYLWAYTQNRGKNNFTQFMISHNKLNELLSQNEDVLYLTKDLKKMNLELYFLVQYENNHLLEKDRHNDSVVNDNKSNPAIQSRINIVSQDMNNEIIYIYKKILNNKSTKIQNLNYYTQAGIIFISLVVMLLCFYIKIKFKRSFQRFINGIKQLSRSNFDYKIPSENQFTEFENLSCYFNKMAALLNHTTISKSKLKEEVENQTSVLNRQKESLVFLSEHDSLTNIYNRRAIEKHLIQLTRNFRGSENSFSLFFIDLNLFKDINDSHGHEAGDAVLKSVASRLSSIIDESDMVGRFGGDEFIIIHRSHTTGTSLSACALRYIQEIEKVIHFKGKELCVGASIGIALYPEHGSNVHELLTAADKSMYQSKRSKASSFTIVDNSSSLLKRPMF
ncbi:diguanylate cyclase [Vibrio sp. 7-5(1-a)]|nr:diguanylate cyclase [Vibrio sp. 2-2(2)]NNO03189.1 diguanylate cyclase [Vibrio sp. 7-5(1-a)]